MLICGSQAQSRCDAATIKYELLKVSIERRLLELPAGADPVRIHEIRQELNDNAPLTTNAMRTSTGRQFAAVSKPAALTGTLIVRLVGCQELYEETNLRNSRAQSYSSLAAFDTTSRQRSFINRGAAKRASRDDLSCEYLTSRFESHSAKFQEGGLFFLLDNCTISFMSF